MTYFKKFTDFVCGAMLFVAALFLIKEYMSFVPEDKLYELDWALKEGLTTLPSKLSQFLHLSTPKSYTAYPLLLGSLAVSLIVGRVFAKLPSVCFAVAFLPFLQILYMLDTGRLYEQKELYLIAGSLHLLGNAADALMRDRQDGRHRLFRIAKISMSVPLCVCAVFFWLLPQRESAARYITDSLVHETKVLAIMFAIILAISLILYNVYFVDALLSLVPLGYTVYAVYARTLSFCPVLFLACAVICTAVQFMLMLFENNLSLHEQNKKSGL